LWLLPSGPDQVGERKRPSDSRPGEGIITVHTVGRNQDGAQVIEFDRTLLASMRNPVDPATGPQR